MWLVILVVAIALLAGRENIMAYVTGRGCIEGVYFSYGEGKYMVLEACTARFAGVSARRKSVSKGVHFYESGGLEISVEGSVVSGMPVHSVLNVRMSNGFHSEMTRCVRWPFGKLEFVAETKGVSRHSRVVIEGTGYSVSVVIGNNNNPRSGYAMLADGHVLVKISGVLRVIVVDLTGPHLKKATLIDRSGLKEEEVSYGLIGKPVSSKADFEPIPTSHFEFHLAM
jgi:hypothetical protein